MFLAADKVAKCVEKMPVKKAGPGEGKYDTTTRTRHVAHSSSSARICARKEFLKATVRGEDEQYTNPESIPPSNVSFAQFLEMYPKFAETKMADEIRRTEYEHLEASGHACFDYSGFGLFSHRQKERDLSCSSFSLAYVTGNLPTHALYGAADEGTVEGYMRKRIFDYLNISEVDYSMVFTASRGTAFKLLAESYPFHVADKLLTAYDHESESVKWMAERAKRLGAKIMSAHFKWPSLRICSTDLKKQMRERWKKKDSAKGLFVFPVQSRLSGAKYSYQWMSHAQSNHWHVLLDASALGPKDMGSLGLSLFRPDFIITSFYKVFGADPTGFGCLFIKNSAIHSLHNSSRARGVGMVRIVPMAVQPTTWSARGDSLGGKLQDGERQRRGEEQDEADDFMPSPEGIPAFSGPVASFYANAESGSLLLGSSNRFTGDDGEYAFYQNQSHGKGFMESTVQYSSDYDGGNLDNSRRLYSHELGSPGSVSVPSASKVYPSGSNYASSNLAASGSLHWGDQGREDNGSKTSGRVMDELFEGEEVEFAAGEPRGVTVQDENHAGISPSRAQDSESPEQKMIDDSHDGEDISFSYDLGFEAEKPENDRVVREESFTLSPSLLKHGQIVESGRPSRIVTRGDTEDEEDAGVMMDDYPYKKEPCYCLSQAHMNGDKHIRSGYELPPSCSPEGNNGVQTHVESSGGEPSGGVVSRETERGYDMYGLREGEDLDRDRMITALSRELLQMEVGDEVDAFELSEAAYPTRRRQWERSSNLGDYAEDEGSIYSDQYGYEEEDEEENGDSEPLVVCSGLNHADSLGLTRANLRLRFLINWLVFSLLQLRHPGTEEGGIHLVHIYGPKVKFDRGQSMAFNVLDCTGKLLQPGLVQRLADRSNIGLGLGVLQNIIFAEASEYVPGLVSKKSDDEASKSCIPVVIASVGFLTNFEDVYRLWHFVAKFLDVDFVAREVWRYQSLNQKTVVVGQPEEDMIASAP